MLATFCTMNRRKIFSQALAMFAIIFLYLGHAPLLDSLLAIFLPFKNLFDFSLCASLILVVFDFIILFYAFDFIIFVFQKTSSIIKSKKEKFYSTKKLSTQIVFADLYKKENKFIC